MQKFIGLIVLLMISSCASQPPTSQDGQLTKKEQKAQKKAQKATQEKALNEQAKLALQKQWFVLETHTLTNNKGRPVNVSTNTNFIAVKGETAVIQIAFPGGVMGPNNIGGITVDGNISNVDLKENDNGRVYMTFSVLGAGVNAQVRINLDGSNYANGRVSSQTRGGYIEFRGIVVPYEKSRIYQAPSRF
ncbi:DUF4251 domain-containing protein [Algivirga pacifica]|uniref:DUF4251 domain-containing protein n=1 Tax=Algivirga pacifica TaxID=1162670 RepID=A0ABP9D4A8_9BACT